MLECVIRRIKRLTRVSLRFPKSVTLQWVPGLLIVTWTCSKITPFGILIGVLLLNRLQVCSVQLLSLTNIVAL